MSTKTNFLEMSDEDIANFDPSKLVVESSTDTSEDTSDTSQVVVDETSEEDNNADNNDTDDTDSSTTEDNTSDTADEEETESKDQPVTASNTDEDESTEAKPETVKNKPVEAQKETPKETPAETKEVDYKAVYETIFQPFKANGKDFKVESAEEAVTLMQMGVGFNKKMAALKPNLKLMKMLENNNLLDEGKLSYLIDLDKRDPAAITKLIKESGIDPLGIDTEKASDYRAKSYAPDDRELELDAVLDQVKDSSTYSRTLQVIAEEWDAASKQAVGNTPVLVEVINDHMQRGIYDIIKTEVDRQRVLGRLNGLNDISAYRVVGDQIEARGGFASLSAKGKGNTQETVIVTPKAKVNDVELKNKKRAASSTKPAASSGLPSDFNPLALSDDEFSKMVKPGFL